jgi:hypothetical protein
MVMHKAAGEQRDGIAQVQAQLEADGVPAAVQP